MVHLALHHLAWRDLDYLFIENVGNLVCPAVYDLGQAANVVLLSVTEGEDKPLKYPVMFYKADLVLISKIDLLPHLPDVSLGRIVDSLRRVMPNPKYVAVSARTEQGIDQWIAWLQEQERQADNAHPERHARSDHSHA
jgi:hydrogenase nickel incorporation protein HypB